MVETFRKHWPSEVNLRVYQEGFQIEEGGNVWAREFPEWFLRWKQRWLTDASATGRNRKRNRPRKPDYDFRQDCVKFAHKVAAFTDWAIHEQDEGPSDILIWMDADTVTHAQVTTDWLDHLLFGSVERDISANVPLHDRAATYMAWLDRARLYPECGFLMFNVRHPRHVNFMGRLRHVYESGHVLSMSETHDSYVIEQIVKACVAEGWFPAPRSLSGEARLSHHPFPLSELGSRLDHAKGARKSTGRTPRHELAGRRTEGHWR